MGRFNFLSLLLCQAFGLFSNCPLHGFCSKEIENFQKFSNNVFSQTNFSETSTTTGAISFSPFGIGYMLANINSKVWNISSIGFENILNVPQNEISDQYASLGEKLKQANIRSSNAVYAENCTNCTINLPEESQKLHTSLNYIDWENDWYNSWHLMNDMTSNQLDGALNDSVVPKGGWYGGPFNRFSVGAFINTNYFKSSWAQRWNEIGYKNFSDGFSVPFYQVEGIYPTYETDNLTAVAIQLSDAGKFGVFVNVKESSSPNFSQDELSALLQNGETWMNPSLWPMAQLKRKIQVPRLNFTLYNQYYMGFENVSTLAPPESGFGIHTTFCPWDIPMESDESKRNASEEYEYWIARKPFFAHPIVQTNYIHLSPDFLELASATGMVANSMKKYFGDYEAEDNEPDDNNGNVEEGDSSLQSSKSQYEMGTENLPDAKAEERDKDTIRFDQPFYWYLYDSEIGPVQHGWVQSFAKYKKSYDDILNDPHFNWLLDLVLSRILWSCPYK